jgi:hypothetical protein
LGDVDVTCAAEPRLVIVDTNCYVRLLFCDALRPILTLIVGGHRLMTLEPLAAEAMGGRSPLVQRFPWLLDKSIQGELVAGILPLPENERELFQQSAAVFRAHANRFLDKYCAERRIQRRSLSAEDCMAWTVAAEYEAVLATDEWPLREACGHVQFDDEQPGLVDTMTTLDLLQLFERDGRIGAEQRRLVVKQWVASGECLLRGWEQHYEALFAERPVLPN